MTIDELEEILCAIPTIKVLPRLTAPLTVRDGKELRARSICVSPGDLNKDAFQKYFEARHITEVAIYDSGRDSMIISRSILNPIRGTGNRITYRLHMG